MSSRYNANYLSNLNCWLNSFQKESDDFTKVLSGKSTDEECNLEIPKILRARQNDFWYKKEELADKNSQTYKKVESDLNDQVKIIEDLQNRNH